MGPLEKVVREKLSNVFTPSRLDIENESPKHGLPLEAEKHFRVVIVSELFEGLERIDRHRRVHTVLGAELKEHIHALSVQAYTPQEYQTKNPHLSPDCQHARK